MHIGSIQQIDEDDQSKRTKDGQFWVVTGGDKEIFFFCIGQTVTTPKIYQNKSRAKNSFQNFFIVELNHP